MKESLFGNIDLSNMTITKYSDITSDLISIDNIGEITLNEGDTIGVDLGNIRSIGSIEILGFCSEKDFIIETSIDNEIWEESAIGLTTDLLKDAFAKYVRIRALRNSKAEIYEIEVYVEATVYIKSNIEVEEEEVYKYISEIFSNYEQFKETSILGKKVYEIFINDKNKKKRKKEKAISI